MEFKAIETRYKNCRFRSRLEARWAVFLDAVKVPWEYEKEGFSLPSGAYLPDFWISNPMPEWPYAGYWLEIKPSNVSAADLAAAQQKMAELTESTKHTSHILCGTPEDCKAYFYNFYQQKWILDNDIEYPVGHRDPVLFHLVYSMTHELPVVPIEQAIAAAMSARFEYGESGAPK